MADMYEGFRPWELMQGGFSQLGQTGQGAFQAFEQKRALQAPLDPHLDTFYKGLLEHIGARQAPAPDAPQLQGFGQLQAPQAPQFQTPQNVVPDVGMHGLQVPGQESPAGGPQGPYGRGAQAPSAGGLPLQTAPQPQAQASAPQDWSPPPRGTHKFVDDILYGGAGSATVATQPGQGSIPQAPAPRAGPAPGVPTSAKSTMTGRDRPFTQADLPMLEKLLPIAIARMNAEAAQTKVETQEKGRGSRAELSAKVKSAIAQLRADSSMNELASKIERDLSMGAEKMDDAQQQAWLKAMVELELGKMRLEGARYGADAKARIAGSKPGVDEAAKLKALITRLESQPATGLLDNTREAINQALEDGRRRWPEDKFFQREAVGAKSPSASQKADAASTLQSVSDFLGK